MSLPLFNSTYAQNAFGIFIYGNSVSNGLATPIFLLVLGIIFVSLGIQLLGLDRGATLGGFVTWFSALIFNIGEALNDGVVATVSLIYLLWLLYLYKEGST